MAWDVTVPNTFAEFHVSSTAAEQGLAAKQAADNKTAKYQGLEKTHIFFPAAIETAGSTIHMFPVPFVQLNYRFTSENQSYFRNENENEN